MIFLTEKISSSKSLGEVINSNEKKNFADFQKYNTKYKEIKQNIYSKIYPCDKNDATKKKHFVNSIRNIDLKGNQTANEQTTNALRNFFNKNFSLAPNFKSNRVNHFFKRSLSESHQDVISTNCVNNDLGVLFNIQRSINKETNEKGSIFNPNGKMVNNEKLRFKKKLNEISVSKKSLLSDNNDRINKFSNSMNNLMKKLKLSKEKSMKNITNQIFTEKDSKYLFKKLNNSSNNFESHKIFLNKDKELNYENISNKNNQHELMLSKISLIKTLKGHTGSVYSIILLKNRYNFPLILTGSSDGTIKIWNYITGECLNTIDGLNSGINCLLQLKNTNFFICGNSDCKMRLFCFKIINENSIKTELLKIIEGHKGSISKLIQIHQSEYNDSFNKEKNSITINTNNSLMSLYNVIEGNLFFISVSGDKVIKFWKINYSFEIINEKDSLVINYIENVMNFLGHTSWIFSLTKIKIENNYLNENKTATKEENINSLRNNLINESNRQLSEKNFNDLYLDSLRNRKYLIATGDSIGEIKIWDIKTGICYKSILAHTGGIYDLIQIKQNSNTSTGNNTQSNSFIKNSNPTLIASVSCDKTIKIHNIETSECIKIISGHSKSINSLIQLKIPDCIEYYLVSCSSDKNIKIWNLDNSICIKNLHNNNDSEIFSILQIKEKYLDKNSKREVYKNSYFTKNDNKFILITGQSVQSNNFKHDLKCLKIWK